MTNCQHCDQPAELVTGDVIYPHRRDLIQKYFWACFPCKAWVGCHGNTKNAMGNLANEESRKLKSAAHSAFDPIWKSGYMTRTEAYAWLQRLTGLSKEECHMGWMSNAVLKGVTKACNQYCKDKGINTYYA